MLERANLCLALLSIVLGLATPSAANAQAPVPLELELVLAVDISASVDQAEFDLQMSGLAKAFRDPAVIAAIEAQGPEGIAVTLLFWSAKTQHALPWTQVRDRRTSEAFGGRIASLPRPAVGRTTAIGTAIRDSGLLFENNRFEGRRRSIDISGDGQNNSGKPIWVERKAAIGNGITINGLAILDGDSNLESYYRNYVIGGSGSFVVAARDFADFARAIRLKLLREINPAVAEDPRHPHGTYADLSPR